MIENNLTREDDLVDVRSPDKPIIPMKSKLLLVDDHEMTLDVLKSLLGDLPDIEIVGSACCGEDALTLVRSAEPDLVLMDLILPGISGIETTRRILAEFPTTRVAFLSMYTDKEDIAAAREAGALAYLFKSDSAKRLIPCLRAILAGTSSPDPWFPSTH